MHSNNNLQKHHQSLAQMHKFVNILLARRDYSAYEIEQKLLHKGFEEEQINNFIHSLKEQKLLDDLRFAQTFVRYQYRQGKGENWIKQGLKQKGVADEKIQLALTSQADELDWHSQIVKLVNLRRFDLTDIKQKAKAYRFLAARGFKLEQINSALKADFD